MHRTASVALLLRTARQLQRRYIHQRAPPTSPLPVVLGGLVAAASCCTSVAYCDYGESSAGEDLNWGQLVTRLGAHDVTHAKRTTPNGARYELSIRAAPGADMHSVLVSLLSAFAPEDAQMSAADAPSSTALTVSAGPYTLEFNVPRVRAFDAHVTLVVEVRGAIEPSFSEAQVRSLERAAAVAATPGATARSGGNPRDAFEILDEHNNPFACRNPHMDPHDTGQGKYARAKEQLRELGVDVMDASEMNETFDSLAGYTEVKKRIENTLVLPLKHPEIYDSVVRGTREKYKSNVPRAVMLSGPPGCGKTHSARILAATIGVPFVHVPLESLLSKYYGETTRRLAQVLEACNGLGRSIVFVDEIDALGADRGSGEVHEVSRRTLSVLLRFLDGVDGPRDAVLLAATNCADDVDAALLSRFDCVLDFPLPDKATRTEILSLYARHLSDSERKRIADTADGFSGREILDSCEEAERTHAGRVVRGEMTKDTLPDVDAYLLAVKRKIPMSVSRVEQRKAARRRGAWRNPIMAG